MGARLHALGGIGGQAAASVPFYAYPICVIQLSRGSLITFTLPLLIPTGPGAWSPPQSDAIEDHAPLSFTRPRMNGPSAQKRAVLRAVGEDNRALATGADIPSRGAGTGWSRFPRERLRHERGRRAGRALLIAGLLLAIPAMTDTAAHLNEKPPFAPPRSDPESSGPRLSIVIPGGTSEPAADLWRSPFSNREALAPSLSFQDHPGVPEAAPEQIAMVAFDPVLRDGALGPSASMLTDGTHPSAESNQRINGFVDQPILRLDTQRGIRSTSEGLPIVSLFGLNVGTIVIDAGHGGVDPGAVGASGTREKDITLDVARRLASRLERSGRYRVVLTRAGDETLSLARRVELANAAHADLFLSIHVNSLPNRQVNVIETYYFDISEDPAALQLAAIENRDSGMPLGYFRSLLETIGDTVKLEESKALAQHIQTSMIDNVRNQSTRVFDSGVKVAPFVVLMGVGVPAVLVEISCISNRDEEIKLQTSDYREKVASFLEQGITRYLDHRQLQAQGPAHHERENVDETANHRRQGG